MNRFVPTTVFQLPRIIRWLFSLWVVCTLTSCGRHDSDDRDSSSKRRPSVKGKFVHVTGKNFEKEVLASSSPVLVEFWAEWCGPCRQLAPTLAELSVEYDGRVKVAKVNIDKEAALAEKYEIRAIPAMLLFRQTNVVDQLVGLQPKSSLQALLNKVAPADGAGDGEARPAENPATNVVKQ